MGKRALGAFSFDPPSAWDDCSVVVYEAPDMGAATSKVTVSWLPRGAATPLRAHVTTWAQSLRSTLDGLQFTELVSLVVDGCEALRTSMSWSGPLGAMAGAAVHVDQQGMTKVLTLTCMCTAANRVSSIAAFDKLLASGRFDGGGGSRVPRPPGGSEIDSLFVPMPGSLGGHPQTPGRGR